MKLYRVTILAVIPGLLSSSTKEVPEVIRANSLDEAMTYGDEVVAELKLKGIAATVTNIEPIVEAKS